MLLSIKNGWMIDCLQIKHNEEIYSYFSSVTPLNIQKPIRFFKGCKRDKSELIQLKLLKFKKDA